MGKSNELGLPVLIRRNQPAPLPQIQLPIFSHPGDDIASFRFFTSQLITNGNASQSQSYRVFGVPLVTVKRTCKKLRTEEAAGFFRPGTVPLGTQTHRRIDRRRANHAR